MFWLFENNILRLSQVKDFDSDWVVTKLILKMNIASKHYKRQWYAFLFTDNHDVLYDKTMIWFSSLYW